MTTSSKDNKSHSGNALWTHEVVVVIMIGIRVLTFISPISVVKGGFFKRVAFEQSLEEGS